MSDTENINLQRTAVRGTAWIYAAFFAGKLIIFVTTVILARLLTKDDFGLVGYTVLILSFLDVVRDLGIGPALIYHDENEETASTGFWLGILIGITIFILVWFIAPLAGSFFHDERVTWVLRILALNYPIWALGGVHQALLTKRLAFNKRFIPDFLQAMVKGLLSIALAYSGFGAWSLIIGHLSGTAVSVIAVWLLVSWRPAFAFIRSRSLTLLRFGLPMVGLNIIALIVTNTDYILIGRYLGSESLGIYTLAFRVPELTILYFCSVVAEVLFPLFTRIRDDEEALKKGFLQTILYVSLITVPLGLGMILLADPFIRTLFTDKWLDAVPVMRTIAAYALLLSLAFNAGDVYKARGVPNVLTKIALVKAAVLIPALYYAVTIPKSILFVGYMQIMVAAIGSAINLVVAARMLHIPLLRILSSFVPALISGLGLIAMVLPSMYLFSSSAPWVQLISGTLMGGLGYILVLILVDRPLSNSLLQTIRSLAGNK